MSGRIEMYDNQKEATSKWSRNESFAVRDAGVDIGEDLSSGPSGTTDYSDLSNKPKINGIELAGNKTPDELDIQKELTPGTGISIEYNEQHELVISDKGEDYRDQDTAYQIGYYGNKPVYRQRISVASMPSGIGQIVGTLDHVPTKIIDVRGSFYNSSSDWFFPGVYGLDGSYWYCLPIIHGDGKIEARAGGSMSGSSGEWWIDFIKD